MREYGRLCAFNTTYTNISHYTVAVSFIDGDLCLAVVGNRTVELVIGSDCIGRYKANHQSTAAKEAPPKNKQYILNLMEYNIVVLSKR